MHTLEENGVLCELYLDKVITQNVIKMAFSPSWVQSAQARHTPASEHARGTVIATAVASILLLW